ncbi:MAG: PaaI family thioesterase [Ideonella sp.]|nr:PaaI family thioesterase [Ideonella sp.]MCC7458112.1 PaaI family thioesterase [Nitrospira sp.]
MKIDLDAARAFFAAAPFMVDLGVTPTAVGEGTMTTELRITPRHTQHTGLVHAGVMATLADHTMGAAAQTLAPAGHWVLTAELKTSQLRPARGDRLVCEAQVLKPGRQISFTEAQVWTLVGDERTLVMKASATMAVTAPKA